MIHPYANVYWSWKDNDYLRKVANEGVERARANAALRVRNIWVLKGFKIRGFLNICLQWLLFL